MASDHLILALSRESSRLSGLMRLSRVRRDQASEGLVGNCLRYWHGVDEDRLIISLALFSFLLGIVSLIVFAVANLYFGNLKPFTGMSYRNAAYEHRIIPNLLVIILSASAKFANHIVNRSTASEGDTSSASVNFLVGGD